MITYIINLNLLTFRGHFSQFKKIKIKYENHVGNSFESLFPRLTKWVWKIKNHQIGRVGLLYSLRF